MERSLKKLPTFFSLVLALSFAVLVFKLFALQIVSGAEYSQKAAGNRIKVLPLSAPRGMIISADGVTLGRNLPQGRDYPLGAAAAHVVGYIGEANEDEVAAFTIHLGSQVGKLGLEREEDKLLRGSDGGIVVETDAEGKAIREMSRHEPVPGQDIHLFLEARLQKAAYEALRGRKGAIVVTNPAGEILALVSSPSFDPNLFTQGKDETALAAILSDEKQPLFDRAIAGQYPPGSTFKVVTATAGLETKAISPEEEIEDTGEIRIGKFRFGNWYFDQYGKKEGMVNLVKAFRRSNDIYFYKVGEKVGITKLAAWAKAFGLGEKTNIPLQGEAEGLVPNAEWKKSFKNEDWYLGDTYITAIGQGDLQATPLQINLMTGVMASGGKWCRPKLVDDGSKPECKDLPISEETIKLIKEGMKQACEPGGTGWPLFEFKINPPVGGQKFKIDDINYFKDASAAAEIVRIPVACKTGTAEYGGPKQKAHAWFTVFAPVENPEIVVTVLLEGAGQGSDVAAPVAKDALKTWFESR